MTTATAIASLTATATATTSTATATSAALTPPPLHQRHALFYNLPLLQHGCYLLATAASWLLPRPLLLPLRYSIMATATASVLLPPCYRLRATASVLRRHHRDGRPVFDHLADVRALAEVGQGGVRVRLHVRGDVEGHQLVRARGVQPGQGGGGAGQDAAVRGAGHAPVVEAREGCQARLSHGVSGYHQRGHCGGRGGGHRQ